MNQEEFDQNHTVGRTPPSESEVIMSSGNNSNLNDWYTEYMAESAYGVSRDSAVIKAVEADKLNTDLIERSIREKMSQITVTDSFCTTCQNLFDNWPELAVSSNSAESPYSGIDSAPESEGGWEHTATRPFHTDALEASTRNGCKFCTYMLQLLRDDGLIETFRKIEARMGQLDKESLCTLSIQNWGSNGNNQLLWLNFPNSQCTHCNDDGVVARFQSDLSPTGT